MDPRRRFGKNVLAVVRVIVLLGITCSAEKQISVRTAEMTTPGSTLVNLPQELKLPSVEEREYRILSGNEYARVDARTGILTVASRMDRERLCPDNRAKCTVDVTVVVRPRRKKTSPDSLRIVKVEIEVTDINDNSPRFENSIIDKQISEGVHVATPIRLDSAIDPDLGINSIQKYALRSPSGSKSFEKFFRLGVIKNIDGTKIPQLELRRSLDREKQGVHELILEAIDGGVPPRTGTATVRINVTDSNDNSPSFAEDVYVVDVDEHAKNGTVIIQVHAEDKDTGMNGKIRYKFPSVVSAEDREAFTLNVDTGDIWIKNSNKLDYETKKIHHLTVEAMDLGPNSASAYTTVTVQVQDVNDNKPQVDVSFMELERVNIADSNSEYDAIIREDIDVGSYLAFVTITDEDHGKNGTVSCEITNNDVFDLQSIEENTSRFLLKLVGSLDREEKSFHDIYVDAWDHGKPPQRNRRIVRIKVGDINDNAPTFIHPEYSVGVSETESVGTVVMTLQAKDLDENPGPNSRITYTLLGSDDVIEKAGENIPLDTVFSIDAGSGEIRLIRDDVLDAETVREPGYITVLANDNGIPSLNTTTKVKITVIDENDNDPVFQKDSYVFHIEEHSTDGTYLGQITATDADWAKESNGMVIYSVQRYNEFDGGDKIGGRDARPNSRNFEEDRWMQMFQIDTKTGYLHFYGNKTKLDREARRGRPITIMAVASDNGTPVRKATARVDIFLTDKNDNAPIVTYPDVKRDVAFVQIALVPPAVLSLVGELENENGDGSLSFAGSNTGTDSGHGWASYVVVRSTEYRVADHTSKTITQIRASDPDEGENAQLSFAIVEGNSRGYFQINVKDGNITLATSLDLKKLVMGCHVLKILVKDLGDIQMSSNAYANVFLSRSEPTKVNQSEAMQECQASPVYPHMDEEIIKGAGLDKLTIFIIIGFAVLIFVILIIIVVILVKCKCCGTPSKSRSYNCQQGNNIYSSPIYGNAGKKKRKGHRRPGVNGQGTVDSRSSFHSEWTASQTQIAQEKRDFVGDLPALQSEGSMGSHNSGRDSGTGDSMPSDAYHALAAHTGDMGYQMVSYNPRTQYNLPPQHGYPENTAGYPLHHPSNPNMTEPGIPMGQQHPGNGMMTTKCTEECLVYGHSDACWMPDSLLRPPSRMTSFKQQDTEEMKTPVRNLNHVAFQHPAEDEANDLRYQSGDPNTPYYYDPGRKFVHLGGTGPEYPAYSTGTAGRNFSTFRNENGEEYGMEHPHPGSQAGSYTGSQAPSGLSVTGMQNPNVHPSQVYPGRNGQYGRGRAYVNLQGYDPNLPPQGQNEESHSNLSSASSNTNPYTGGFSHNKQPHYRETNRSQGRYPAYQDTRAPNGYYDPVSNQAYPGTEFQPSFAEHGHPTPYEEDYSASNLLLSPTDNDPDYRQPWERRMPGQGPGYFSPTNHYNSNANSQMYANNREEEERQNLMESRPDIATTKNQNAPLKEPNDGVTQDEKTAEEKLSTIEEIDAEAVVAEIDGLLL